LSICSLFESGGGSYLGCLQIRKRKLALVVQGQPFAPGRDSRRERISKVQSGRQKPQERAVRRGQAPCHASCHHEATLLLVRPIQPTSLRFISQSQDRRKNQTNGAPTRALHATFLVHACFHFRRHPDRRRSAGLGRSPCPQWPPGLNHRASARCRGARVRRPRARRAALERLAVADAPGHRQPRTFQKLKR
jgi:hypothetical protein